MSVTNPRIVVVSESRITRRVVEMTFADQPVQLTVFDKADAATADWDSRLPAVLLADVVQSSTDGYALARALRSHRGGAKSVALLLAGQHDAVDDAEVARAQVSAVLRKPLDSHQLVDAVREALRVGPPEAPAVVEAVAEADLPAVAVPEPVEAVAAAAVTEPAASTEMLAEPQAAAPSPDEASAPSPLVEAVADLPQPLPSDDALVATFHELLDVEQGLRPELSARTLADGDLDRLAQQVATLVSTDAALGARLESTLLERAEPVVAAAAERSAERVVPEAVAAVVERVVRELAPALVQQVAQAVVRDEIARLRGTARVA